jgi:hypothetical protein
MKICLMELVLYMKNKTNSNKYLLHFQISWNIFQIKVVEVAKHIL